MSLIEDFITTHNFYIICLSDTFLDSSIDIKDTRKNINGYSLLRTDHSSNTECSGVSMYYKNYLPVITRTYFSDLQQCIVNEITVDKERCFLTFYVNRPVKMIMDLKHFVLMSFFSLIILINFNHHVRFF